MINYTENVSAFLPTIYDLFPNLTQLTVNLSKTLSARDSGVSDGLDNLCTYLRGFESLTTLNLVGVQNSQFDLIRPAVKEAGLRIRNLSIRGTRKA